MQPPRQLDTLGRDELLQTTKQLLAEADALSSRISALNEIGLAVNESLDLARIERVIAKQAKWLLDFEHCSVCLQEDGVWCIKTLFGPVEPDSVDLATMSNLDAVMHSTRPLIIREGAESTFLNRYQSQIIVPLSADSGFLGTINFATSAPNRYTIDDMRIGYMLSLQLASAMRNANVVAELKATREELRMRVEELDAYGHTIAHDLKSPLNNIMLRAQLFEMRFGADVAPEALGMIAGIEQSGHLMVRMIDQLLLLAKLRSVDEQWVTVKTRATVNAALQRFTHQLEDKAIHVEIAADLPDALGQPQWIEEVFANLISNAIKYMGAKPQPTITISGQTQADHVRFEVRDTGIGIKPEAQGRLFEMFARVHDAPGIEGLGLGLSIVQRIIKKLRGAIGVQSVYGEGTTFWFTLPAISPPPVEVPPVETAPNAADTRPQAPPQEQQEQPDDTNTTSSVRD